VIWSTTVPPVVDVNLPGSYDSWSSTTVTAPEEGRTTLRSPYHDPTDHVALPVRPGHRICARLRAEYRRGHYDLATETEGSLRFAAAFDELTQAV
jgi:hypothetical protein